MMSPIVILPCGLEDSAALVSNHTAAFWPNKRWALTWTRVNKTALYFIEQQTKRRPYQLLQETARRRHQKAVDESTGEIVGYCRWILPEGGDETSWPEAKVTDDVSVERREELKKQFDQADFSPDETLDHVEKVLDEPKKRTRSAKNYMMLDTLAVNPSHQRQGIATKLVESGLREAEKMGYDVWLLAKKQGLGMYTRAGFELLEKVVIDYSEYLEEGQDGIEIWSMMEYNVKRN